MGNVSWPTLYIYHIRYLNTNIIWQVFDALKKSSSDIGMSVMEMSKITSHLSVTQVGCADFKL